MVCTYLLLGYILPGEHSGSPDELIDIHPILDIMKLVQDGCLSTRLDFRNALFKVYGQKSKYIHTNELNTNLIKHCLYFLKFPLYLQNIAAIGQTSR